MTLALVPRYDVFGRESRAFVRRMVLHMLAAGIEKLLDRGAGLGGVRHMHELARVCLNPRTHATADTTMYKATQAA